MSSTLAASQGRWSRIAAGPLLVVAIFVSAADSQTEPRVLVDEGHHNFHTIAGSYATYAGLLKADGFDVSPVTSSVTSVTLAGASVFLTANPLPEPRAVLIQRAQETGERFAWSKSAAQSAYSPAEIAAIRAWVEEGGGLLLVLDHPPYGSTGGALAAAFGADVRNVETTDPAHQESDIAGRLVFSRGDGHIGEHPVMTGVDRVITYLGGSIGPPPGGTILLRLSSSAVDRDWSPETQSFRARTAAGRAQGIAFVYGKGRVVILAEAGVLASEPGSNRAGDGTNGILRPDLSTRRFALNIGRWLAGRAVN